MQSPARAWLWLAIPIIALAELVAHFVELGRVVPESAWRAAGVRAKQMVKPGELVVFAPFWTDPLGRVAIGPDLARFEIAGRADVGRWPRALEMSIHGARNEETASWRVTSEEVVQGVTLRVLENPKPETVRDDTLARVIKGDFAARTAIATAPNAPESEEACTPVSDRGSAGQFYGNAMVPPHRLACARGTFAGMGVFAVGERFEERTCIYAPPLPGAKLRVVFPNFHFGSTLRGYQAISMYDRGTAPVTVTLRSDNEELGRYVIRTDEGWKRFEVDTRELAGRDATLTAEITAAARRDYCFTLAALGEKS